MEEASVAGESPDRSKQRESSAEPTSGSGSPVPEARSSARDPRLAVARESISLGGLDTATRVFSVRDLPKTPETPENADESPAEAGAAGSGTSDPEDAPAATEKRPEDAASPEPADEPGTAEHADDAEGDSGDAGTVEDSGEADSGSEDTGTAEGSDDSEGDSGDADDSGERDEAAAEGDARLRDAVAAWVSKGDGSRAGSEDGPGKAQPAEQPEDKGTEPADETPEDEPIRDTEAKADAETDPEPDSEPAPATDAAETAVADKAPRPDTADPDTPGARGTARPAPTDPRTDDEPDKTPRPDTADPDTPGARGTARPAPTDARTDDEPDEAPEDAVPEKAPEDAVPEDADVDDAPPVDQPTAVFKAPRPPVDQPTTMLKLGKAAESKPAEPAEAKPAEAKPATRKPEAEAERTSRFVALKALDEPRESRPKADVTAAVPQVGPERTTQQPLPPKPPLDLLAELTNTPPPPPSPLRTFGRRVKIWTPLLILLIVVFAIVQALRPLPEPTLSLTAKDSYTFDGSKAALPWPEQGQGWMDVEGVGTMGDFGKQTPVAIGSVAKAMTAYIVLKDHPLKSGEEGAKITVDALAEKEAGYNKQGESTLTTVKQGDVLTQRQAIAAIMIPSANNIARLLARWDAGSEAAFIKKMNDTAKELGMKNTKYTDASGLKESTVSTAEDQVKLGNELVKIPALMEITSMGQWIDPSGQKWYNYNYLVPYNGAIGIKTGTTTAAGGNLLFAARKEVGGETVTLVGAILGQHKSPIIKTVNDVSRVAMLAAQDELTSAKILKKGDVVGYVDDGLGGHTPVVLTKDVTAVGWAGFEVKLSFAADDVPHTAKAGTKVGTLTVGDGEGGAVKVPVTLQKDLTEPGLTDKLTRLG
ncbi:D-alanyl-D-alanine carboxypeptidase [Streptomyces sp. TUS-ST3]|uniref:D-alanyl-D-alanine carboxypeptidase n=1 Tax=Streptomyces sp. TUS-ST3 TaxID=3025591 RepID=UPI0024E10A1C|nr:D-alanyl-D-alanine carboxypeptidase [Streptomyces sp. TUS-ST3]